MSMGALVDIIDHTGAIIRLKKTNYLIKALESKI